MIMLRLLVVLIFASARAFAGDVEVRSLAPGEASPPATLEALSWLSGYWEGEGLGGAAAEHIAPAAGGQMMGAFRHMNEDGSPHFYEFYLFAEEAGSLVLKIKHFNPDLTGWEAKGEFVAFPLVALEERAVYFDGLTFAMTGDDALQAAVTIGDGRVGRFNYSKIATD